MRMISIKPLRKLEHVGKVLNHQLSCARMYRVILLGTTKTRQRWKEYFECLLNGNSNDEEGEMNELFDAIEDLHPVACPTLEEVMLWVH
jgi:hypothetical protein